MGAIGTIFKTIRLKNHCHVLLSVGVFVLCSLLFARFLRKTPGMTEAYTAVYWGAFDPPTSAHRAIIEALIANRVVIGIIVVVNNNSYKSYAHPLQERRGLIQAMLPTNAGKGIVLTWQDDAHSLDYQALAKMTPYPLCAVAGYDAYKKWVSHSSLQERQQYAAIAVIPRGDIEPRLFDKQAFLMKIDSVYKHVSSTQLRACSLGARPEITSRS